MLGCDTGSVARERPVLLQQRMAAALQGGMRALLRALQQYGSSPSAAGTWREAFTEVLQGEAPCTVCMGTSDRQSSHVCELLPRDTLCRARKALLIHSNTDATCVLPRR